MTRPCLLSAPIPQYTRSPNRQIFTPPRSPALTAGDDLLPQDPLSLSTQVSLSCLLLLAVLAHTICPLTQTMGGDVNDTLSWCHLPVPNPPCHGPGSCCSTLAQLHPVLSCHCTSLLPSPFTLLDTCTSICIPRCSVTNPSSSYFHFLGVKAELLSSTPCVSIHNWRGALLQWEMAVPNFPFQSPDAQRIAPPTHTVSSSHLSQQGGMFAGKHFRAACQRAYPPLPYRNTKHQHAANRNHRNVFPFRQKNV